MSIPLEVAGPYPKTMYVNTVHKTCNSDAGGDTEGDGGETVGVSVCPMYILNSPVQVYMELDILPHLSHYKSVELGTKMWDAGKLMDIKDCHKHPI